MPAKGCRYKGQQLPSHYPLQGSRKIPPLFGLKGNLAPGATRLQQVGPVVRGAWPWAVADHTSYGSARHTPQLCTCVWPQAVMRSKSPKVTRHQCLVKISFSRPFEP